MGDNLKAAARFVNDANNAIATLTESDFSAALTHIQTLEAVQKQAKSMRARAIYRASQTVMNSLAAQADDTTITHDIVTLKSLVEQYASGLNEVLSEQETPASSAVQKLAPQTANVTPKRSQPSSFDVQEQIESLKASHAVMAPLIDYAPHPQQRQALGELARLSGEYEAAQLTQKEVATGRKAAHAAVEQNMTMIDLESRMPSFSNFILTTARHLGKTVSLSYQLNHLYVGQSQIAKIDEVLREIGLLIVTQSIDEPQLRRARGLSGAGHISLSGELRSGKIYLSLETTGDKISQDFFETTALKALCLGQTDYAQSYENQRLVISVGPISMHSEAVTPKAVSQERAPKENKTAPSFESFADMELVTEHIG